MSNDDLNEERARLKAEWPEWHKGFLRRVYTKTVDQDKELRDAAEALTVADYLTAYEDSVLLSMRSLSESCGVSPNDRHRLANNCLVELIGHRIHRDLRMLVLPL
jgi:hypothetical protein